MPGVDNSRWACRHSGCEKSFARKEHLTRHERTHSSGDSLYVCKVCLQKFNRSDSLQRHLARHGDVYKPSPSGRSKKACITCHKGKIKCDGNDPCSKCQAKGTICQFEASQELAVDAPITQELSVHEIELDRLSQSPTLTLTAQDEGELPHLHQPRALQTQNFTTISDISKGIPFVDLNTPVVRDPDPQRTLNDHQKLTLGDGDPPNLPEILRNEYVQLYFSHFHHRWPIVHRPHYEEEDIGDKMVYKFTMFMIGGWLSNTSKGEIYAFAMHDHLMRHISSVLGNKTSMDKFQDTLPSSICQAALTNIVFSLQTGVEKLISRAVSLRNTLVAVLQEVGFFKCETTWADEKPGYFVPLRLSYTGERQRLAAYLFKIDKYLSFIRDQPSILQSDDLHYPLPQTYAIWNADGLDVFAARIENEPLSRSQTSMADRLKKAELDQSGKCFATDCQHEDGPILLEDIQLYLCSIQPTIALFWTKMRKRCYSENFLDLKLECPRPRLEALKHHLDRIFCQFSNSVALKSREPLPLAYYHGYEPSGDAAVASESRAKGLLFDTLMLYHVLQIILTSDFRLFSQIARDRFTAPDIELPEYRTQQRAQRAARATTWTSTSLARRSLCHAAEILILHQQNSEFHPRAIDPIAFVALTFSAMAVWVYCMYQERDECEPPATIFAELTKWCGQVDKGREAWIQIGNGCPMEIDGVRLCKCNVAALVGKYKALLPKGWELAERIAPGVLG